MKKIKSKDDIVALRGEGHSFAVCIVDSVSDFEKAKNRLVELEYTPDIVSISLDRLSRQRMSIVIYDVEFNLCNVMNMDGINDEELDFGIEKLISNLITEL